MADKMTQRSTAEVIADGPVDMRQFIADNSTKVVQDARIDRRVRSFFEKVPSDPPAWTAGMEREDKLSITMHEVISQPDGNPIDVVFIRPRGHARLPCVMYLHGGGMMVGSGQDAPNTTFARLIANQGACVAVVDFRNSQVPSRPGKPTGDYPAGLNDCMSALRWINASRQALGVGERVVVAGESGGGNLTLAVMLRCKREAALGLVQGFFALCPYIAGEWPQRPGMPGEILGRSHLDSESNGLFIELTHDSGSTSYGEQHLRARDPLAWPGFATEEDVRGLPPGVICVDECDPLRDEGVNFYRLLQRAGVVARCLMLVGMPHGGALLGVWAAPDVALATARDIAGFARGHGASLAFWSRL